MLVPHVSQWFAPVIGAIKKWFQADSYKADSVSPNLILDFANNRYAANSSAKNFSDILTFTRGSAGTYFDSAGIMRTAAIDTPRFDYDPATGTAKGILIEGQRTNLEEYSVPTTGQWTTGFTTASYGTTEVTDPTGGNNAAKLVIQNNTSNHYFTAKSISFTSGTSYSITVFVKAGTTNIVQLSGGAAAFGYGLYANFLLDGAGSITGYSGCTASITRVSGGWYRVGIVAAATSTTSASGLVLFFIDSGTAARGPSFTGNGTDSIYVWGAQVEAGAFPSSYIPTSGSVVTISADYVANTGSNNVPFASWYNSAGGTLYADYICPNDLATCGILSVSDNTANNRYLMRSTAGQSAGAIVSGGVISYNLTGFYVEPTNTKQAFAATTNDAIQCSNTNLSAADTSITMPVSPNRLNVGFGETSGTTQFSGWIKEARYYNIRVTNLELQRITA